MCGGGFVTFTVVCADLTVTEYAVLFSRRQISVVYSNHRNVACAHAPAYVISYLPMT